MHKIILLDFSIKALNSFSNTPKHFLFIFLLCTLAGHFTPLICYYICLKSVPPLHFVNFSYWTNLSLSQKNAMVHGRKAVFFQFYDSGSFIWYFSMEIFHVTICCLKGQIIYFLISLDAEIKNTNFVTAASDYSLSFA